LRRKRCIEIALEDLELSRRHFAIAMMKLYDESGLSYGQLAPLFGVTRARIQQLVETGRKVDPPP
jgi:plasmid maintenance system antidote protein VapI